MLLAKRFALAGLFMGVLAVATSQLIAGEQRDAQSKEPQKNETSRQHAYLGLKIEPVRPGSEKNLPEAARTGQGLRVVGVAPGSPAAKAGIEENDIITCYDDQKLFSPLQLIGLLRNDKAGQDVELTVLRDDKEEKVKVTVGRERAEERTASAGTRSSRDSSQAMSDNDSTNRGRQGKASQSPSQSQASGQKGTGGETFDSMVLENVGKDRFSVQIEYLNKDGSLEKHRFEGTLKELKQKIEAEKDLPAQERSQLLRSLELPLLGIEIPIGTDQAGNDNGR
jgi:membrane-associated protease RseP (regulator of RpoE activity)